ncbi:MAG: GntR family transcriptional regulator [Erythrobacter sp.]|uniref:GntR family transcriptional regulator n=1 Tax=Erythrobacter sp. TaxID=1042 RepID=UPI001B22CA37|nr:GntR family transcriptional regulator [Erythrobacter sp.]MBO6767658.1 GntR family transcriptional regulator [Erythrobacter sp.]
MTLDLAPGRTRSTPLYLQIAANLKQHIIAGEWGVGEALPSERELCALTDASRVTVRKAIEELISEGLLVRRQGSGTFVNRLIEAKNDALGSFSDEAVARGGTAGTIWIMRTIARPTEDEAGILKIGADSDVVRLGRVRLLDGEPLAIEHAVVPKPFLPPIDDLGESLYKTLETVGNRPVGGTQSIHASLATPTEAGLLSIEEQSAVLRIERVTRNAKEEVVELTRSVYRGDRYKFVSDLHR